MPPSEVDAARDAVEALDGMLADRPNNDAASSRAALAALCALRDRTGDPMRRGALNRLISLVMAVKHPLGAPPWDALIEARAATFPPSENNTCPN